MDTYRATSITLGKRQLQIPVVCRFRNGEPIHALHDEHVLLFQITCLFDKRKFKIRNAYPKLTLYSLHGIHSNAFLMVNNMVSGYSTKMILSTAFAYTWRLWHYLVYSI